MNFTLKKNSEFRTVYKKGRFRAGRFIVMYVLPNKMKVNRIGITTGKRFGNSVQRNRMKRIIRESYRHSCDNMRTGYDIVYVARASERKSDSPNKKLKAVSVPSYHEVDKEMKWLSSVLGILV